MTVTVTCPRCPGGRCVVVIPLDVVDSVDAAQFAAAVGHELDRHLEEIGA